MEQFSDKLLEWHKNNHRNLPWKADRDPYRIWISEIILQQTRVDQGLPYFEKFIEHFPDLETLAKASEDQVLQVWQGLGYYSRARNLHHTAKHIYYDLSGEFPDNYKALLQLKGIGPYTAAAIASFAFDEVKAVVDGNVIRVLSRLFNIDSPFDTTDGRQIFNNLANELIAAEDPASYNQAIMDFGAMQCKPANPDCTLCPMKKGCLANQKNKVSELPVRAKKISKKNRYFIFFNIKSINNQTLIQKRAQKDIWKGLYQFPLKETDQQNFEKDATDWIPDLFAHNLVNPVVEKTTESRQILTHQIIHAKFIKVSVDDINGEFPENFFLVDYENLCNFAFPKIIDWFIVEN
jgi:A/G-specific adenine glycosylase